MESEIENVKADANARCEWAFLGPHLVSIVFNGAIRIWRWQILANIKGKSSLTQTQMFSVKEL